MAARVVVVLAIAPTKQNLLFTERTPDSMAVSKTEMF